MNINSDIFLRIGQSMVKNEPMNVIFSDIEKKTYKEYNEAYIYKLETQIYNLKKEISLLDENINDFQNKNINLIKKFSNKKIHGNSYNLIYSNKSICKYFTSINTLDSEKFKYNTITIEQLTEEKELLTKIINKLINYKIQAETRYN